VKRTLCYVCGKNVALKSDGTIRFHGQRRVQGKLAGIGCPGSGQYPSKQMPTLETPDELAEAIATMLGYYGTHDDTGGGCDRGCRLCFTTDMADRIRRARDNEQLLQKQHIASAG